MKKIFLDTNFLLIPAQFGVDIFEELKKACDFHYEINILNASIQELKKIIRNQTGKDKDAAKLAIKLLEQKVKEKSLYITSFSNEAVVDDILVSLADEDNFIATQDKELKKRVLQKNSKVLTLKNKKYIEITE